MDIVSLVEEVTGLLKNEDREAAWRRMSGSVLPYLEDWALFESVYRGDLEDLFELALLEAHKSVRKDQRKAELMRQSTEHLYHGVDPKVAKYGHEANHLGHGALGMSKSSKASKEHKIAANTDAQQAHQFAAGKIAKHLGHEDHAAIRWHRRAAEVHGDIRTRLHKDLPPTGKVKRKPELRAEGLIRSYFDTMTGIRKKYVDPIKKTVQNTVTGNIGKGDAPGKGLDPSGLFGGDKKPDKPEMPSPPKDPVFPAKKPVPGLGAKNKAKALPASEGVLGDIGYALSGTVKKATKDARKGAKGFAAAYVGAKGGQASQGLSRALGSHDEDDIDESYPEEVKRASSMAGQASKRAQEPNAGHQTADTASRMHFIAHGVAKAHGLHDLAAKHLEAHGKYQARAKELKAIK